MLTAAIANFARFIGVIIVLWLSGDAYQWLVGSDWPVALIILSCLGVVVFEVTAVIILLFPFLKNNQLQ